MDVYIFSLLSSCEIVFQNAYTNKFLPAKSCGSSFSELLQHLLSVLFKPMIRETHQPLAAPSSGRTL